MHRLIRQYPVTGPEASIDPARLCASGLLVTESESRALLARQLSCYPFIALSARARVNHGRRRSRAALALYEAVVGEPYPGAVPAWLRCSDADVVPLPADPRLVTPSTNKTMPS